MGAEGARQSDRLRPRIRQRLLRQRLHEPFEGRIEPPIERRARHPWDLRLEVGRQDVRLIGAARGPRRDDHRPHPHHQVPLTLSLEHPPLLAQAVHLLLR
jgi:hypothetical protein